MSKQLHPLVLSFRLGGLGLKRVGLGDFEGAGFMEAFLKFCPPKP